MQSIALCVLSVFMQFEWHLIQVRAFHLPQYKSILESVQPENRFSLLCFHSAHNDRLPKIIISLTKNKAAAAIAAVVAAITIVDF